MSAAPLSMSMDDALSLAGVGARAHASSLFIPTTRLWAALKSRLLLNQAGFGSRNLSEVSSKHRITDLYAWTLTPPMPRFALE